MARPSSAQAWLEGRPCRRSRRHRRAPRGRGPSGRSPADVDHDPSRQPGGGATTFESAGAATVVTGVPAKSAPGDVLLTFVETRRGSTVTCTSGATRILDHTHGAGTRLAACLTVVGQSVPSAVQVRISPRNQVTAVTMAFAGVNSSSAVDVMAALVLNHVSFGETVRQ